MVTSRKDLWHTLKTSRRANHDGETAPISVQIAGTDAEMMAPWTLKAQGKEVFTMPKAVVVRGFVMNHIIHHRGQMSVYLRLQNVPLPSIYGPTADERW